MKMKLYNNAAYRKFVCVAYATTVNLVDKREGRLRVSQEKKKELQMKSKRAKHKA